VNLRALFTRFDITWLSRTGSPVIRRGTSGATRGGEVQALGGGLLAEEGHHGVHHLGGVHRDALQVHPARLHLREVQDVVDDGEQALARAGDHLRVAPLPVR
jgi:hypothetical protein